MALQEYATAFGEGIVSTFAFLGDYLRKITLLTFRPRRFSRQFAATEPARKLLTPATLFLLTTALFLAVLLEVINKFFDTRSSMNDVGVLTVIQSGKLWDISLDELAKRAIPLAVAMLSIDWALAWLCGKDDQRRRWLREIFPYMLWRAMALFLAFIVLIATLLAIYILIAFSAGALWLILPDAILSHLVMFVLLVCVSLTAWRLLAFLARLCSPENPKLLLDIRSWVFTAGVIASLAIPAWWSTVALSSGADKVAIADNKEIQFDADQKLFSVKVEGRNLSGEPLSATDVGSYVQWWDDEHPVTEASFFDTKRVPNGVFRVSLPSTVELKDGYVTLPYKGDLANAQLVPRSFSDFDGLGGPEVSTPSKREYDATFDSLRQIWEGNRRGRIELVFAVVTQGNTISYRAISLSKDR